MTLCQTVLLDFDSEIESTRKMLERVKLTDETRGYKPHEKSMRFDLLASHVAEIPGWMQVALEMDVFHLDPAHKPEQAATSEELMALFEENVKKGRAAIEAATDETMKGNWTFEYGDKFSMTDPRTKVVRSFVNHMVHHRAQLGVYLRLQGEPMPGMYGPSADDVM